MGGNDRARRQADQALAVPVEPVPRLDPSGFDPSRKVRRTISSFETAPRDGTLFHILNTVRFNPCAKRFEALCHTDDDKKVWRIIEFAHGEPTMWLREVPLPYEIPSRNWFAYTMTYTFRCKTRRERLADWLWSKLPESVRTLADIQRVMLRAIATEARRAETPQDGSVHEGAGRSAASPKGSGQ